MSDVQKFENLSRKVDGIIKDFKLELNLRDAKIAQLKSEIDHLHIRLSIHWESNPNVLKKLIVNAEKKKVIV